MPAKTTAQLKKKSCKPHSAARTAFRKGESGNIFFTLFGAVAIVGLLGAVVVATIRGPLSTMVEVQNRAKAEAEMSIASRMVLLEAAQLTADGDCDGDGFVEPLEYVDSAGAGPGGGGFLPLAVASSRTDPWGTDYGYCSWDAGSATTTIGCDNDSSGTNQRLEGNGNPTDETYTVVALISAGPDQKFDSSCSGGPTPSVVKGGDDIVTEFNYAEARASADGLWNLKTGDPGTAEIDKNLEVSGQGAFSGGIDLTGSSAALELGAASMLFPNESTLSSCNAANDGLIRINTSSDPNSLQLCDDPTGWVSVGAELWETGTGDDIYYNEGSPQVGIGTTSPNEALHVVGNILASGNFSGANITGSGNAAIAGTLGVTGTSTLSALNATGAVDFDTTLNTDGAVTFGSTLGVTGATTLSTLNATGAVDFDSTLNTDGAVTFGSTLGVTGTSNLAAVNASGAVDFNSTLNVDGATTLTSTLDAQGTISNTTGDVTVGDNLNVSGNIDGSDITASGDLIANSTIIVAGDQLGPPLTCGATQKLEWNVGAGWSCVTDLQGGSGGGAPSLDDLTDVVIATATNNDCLAYDAVDGRWENTPCSATAIFENVSSVVRMRAAAGDYATDDFVFGSAQLADAGNASEDNRFFFDKSKAAFRAGGVAGNEWDDANVGVLSFASGLGAVASGFISTSMGNNNIASGDYSFAVGVQNLAAGDYSVALGRQVDITATGDGSMGIGLTTTSPAVDPVVSGAQSFGIFMGNQSGYDLTTANRMALVGGDFLLDDAGATGSQGCFRYNGAGGTLQFSNDCTTFFNLSGTNSNVFEITGGAGTELVRTVNANAPYSTSDFLFGASQLADTGNVSEQNRVFFDKSKASFRAGAVTSTQWDDANVGVSSTAIGSNVTASGVGSTAIGSETVAGGLLSTSTGFQTSAGGDYSFTLGNQVATTSAGDASVAFGLTTTSPATDPVVSGTQSFGIFMGDQSGYDLSTNNRMGLIGGDFMIDDAGATGAQGCIRYNGATTKLEISNDCTTFVNADGSSSGVFEVAGTPGAEVVRTVNAVAPTATSDFVFGSSQLADAGNAAEDNRMFFDKSKGSFRAGGVTGTEWDDTSVGDYSVALGYNARAQGLFSFSFGWGASATADYGIAMGESALADGGEAVAIGDHATSSGSHSTAIGDYVTATGTSASAFGVETLAAGDFSTTMGKEVTVSALGDGSMGIGLTTSAQATDPIVSGAESLGIFLGDHSAVNFAAARTAGIFGGSLVIDPNEPATQLTARGVIDVGASTGAIVLPRGTTAQQPGTPTGGMFRYNTTATPADTLEYYDAEAATWRSLAASGAGSVSYIDDLLDAETDYVTDFNLFMGSNAGAGVVVGSSYNLAIGQNALDATLTNAADGNLAIGYNTMTENTSGSINTAIGQNALQKNTSAYGNTALGNNAMRETTTGGQNTGVGAFSLEINTTGSANTGFGWESLGANTTGVSNTAVGHNAMYTNNSGGYNTALGSSALRNSTTGNNNTALGRVTIFDNSSGSANVAIGDGALYSNTAGNQSVAIGYDAMAYANSSGTSFTTYNTAVGTNALRGSATAASNTGVSNTALGHSTLMNVTSGSSNVAIGDRAADNVTTGSSNITIGASIDAVSATGSSQLNIGDSIYGDMANDRIRIGGSGAVTTGPFTANPPAAEAIAAAATITANACGTIKQISSTGAVTTGTTNTFTAPTAAYAGCCMDVVNVDTADTITLDDNANFLTGGGANIALAPNDSIRVCSNGTYWYHVEDKVAAAAGSMYIDDLLDSETDYVTDLNLFMGSNAGAGVVVGSSYNLAIGQNALDATLTNAADGNLAIGYNTMTENTSGSINTAIGQNALQKNTSAYGNTALGNNAMRETTTGGQNTGVGAFSLEINTTGSANTGFGWESLGANTTGVSNTAVGHNAMYTNNSGGYNTALGSSALRNSTTGNNNTALGRVTIFDNSSGSANVAIGDGALYSNTAGNQSVAIGYDAMAYANSSGTSFTTYNTAVGTNALRGSATAASNTGVSNTALGHSTLMNVTSGSSNVAIGDRAADNVTTGSSNITIGASIDAVSATGSSQLNIGDSIYGDMANDRIRIGGSGAVTTGPFTANPPAAEAIAAAATITANACGTIKQISSTGAVTTGTTNTFTAPTAAYAGCCMDVVNVDTADTITLDDNANFLTGGGANIALAPNDSIRVCSNGTYWYHVEDKVAAAAGSMYIDDLLDSETDYVTDLNLFMGSNAGAGVVVGSSYNLAIGQNALDATLTNAADGNLAIGYNTMTENTSGSINTAIGQNALQKNTSAYGNTALGNNAMRETTTGGQNTGVGAFSLEINTTGSANTGFGWESLGANTTGVSNTAVGHNAMYTNNSGGYNTALGSSALRNSTTGNNNTALGRVTIFDNSSGSANVAIGDGALYSNTAGNQSVAIGYDAMAYANSSGTSFTTYNTAVGTNALRGSATAASNTGVSNTALGHSTLMNVTSGSSNVAIGDRAADNVTTGSSNITIGASIDAVSATGSSQLNIGDSIYGDMANDRIRIGGSGAVTTGPFTANPPAAEAIAAAATITANACGTIKQISSTGAVTTGTTNTFTAPTAAYAGCCMDVVNVDTADTITLDDNANFLTGGGANIALAPNDSIRVCSNGTYWYHVEDKVAAAAGSMYIDDLLDSETDYVTDLNLFMGSNAGAGVVVGSSYNLAIGQNALDATLTNAADGNLAIGYNTMTENTSGSINTAIGQNALQKNTSAYGNTALGNNAMRETTTGGQNTGVGAFSLEINTTGSANTGFGWESLGANTTGVSNTAVGHNAMYTNNSGGYNTALGSSALRNSTTGNNNTALGRVTIFDNSSGSANVAIGDGALYSNTAGNQSVAIGYDAMAYANSSGTSFTTYNTAVGTNALRGSATAASNTGVSNTALGHSTLMNVTSGSSNVAIGDRAADNVTTGSSNITIGASIDAVSATGSSQLNIGDSIYGDMANDRIRIGGSGAVTTGPFTANPPAAEAIAAAATITANACGTIKQISSTGAVTTGTTNTFTAPTAAYAGCCMDVVNVDTADTITLDDNANFLTGGGANIALAPNDSIRVCSNGTYWYHVEDKVAGAAAASLSSLTAATATNTIDNTLYAQVWNWSTLSTQTAMHWNANALTSGKVLDLASSSTAMTGTIAHVTLSGNNAANTGTLIKSTVSGASSAAVALMATNAGTGLTARFNDDGTDGDTTPVVIDAAGFVGIGMTAPSVALDVTGDIEYTGTITDVSDIRLKTDIHALTERTDLLSKIDLINTYSFRMKNDKTKRIEFGVMAQDLEKIFPELVNTAKDEMGTKSVNYVGLIAPMIEATKDLRAENKSLRAEIAAIKAANDNVQASLNKINAQVDLLNRSALGSVNKAGFIPGFGSLAVLGFGILIGMMSANIVRRYRKSG